MRTDGLGKTRDFLDSSVIARLTPIPFMSRRPMQGSVSGRHTSPHRGSSVEFAEYRKYVPGDDPRRLDWRAVGRSDRFYVKEFEADTNFRCIFVVDTSGSMAFETSQKQASSVALPLGKDSLATPTSSPAPSTTKSQKSKLAYARSLAGTLAYLAVEQGDAVGLALASDKLVREIPARRNAAHLSHIFDALDEARAHGATQLPEILHQLAETVSRRALFLVISDLFIDPIIMRSCFEHLRFRQHDVGVFHLLAPEELNFTFQRPTRFLDMEGGPALFVEPTEIVDRYKMAMAGYLNAMQKLMLETSTDYQRVSTDEPYADVLSRFLIGRANRRSGR
jgi:uncharacterized protein (DUF58 family)